jgi:hypothetical protein
MWGDAPHAHKEHCDYDRRRLFQKKVIKVTRIPYISFGRVGNFPGNFGFLLKHNSGLEMVSLVDSQGSTINSTAAIQRLARAISISNGQFSLLLACCNSVNKQQQILSFLEEFSSVRTKEIWLSPSSETLYTTISKVLEDSTQPEVLMVRGLDSVVAINHLIISTNVMRDEFRKQFQFPLVLWVNDEILRKLVWLAPDLKDWAASTIRFDMPSNQLINTQALIA